MSLLTWSYVAMLAFLLAGTPFLLWDLWATEVGHWRFDADQTLPWHVAGMPLVAVLTHEAVRVARHGVARTRLTTSPVWRSACAIIGTDRIAFLGDGRRAGAGAEVER